MTLRQLINHTPAKLVTWKKYKNHVPISFSYEAYFPDGFSILGESFPTKEEAKADFIRVWNEGIMTDNGRFPRKLYPYWG